MLVHHFYAMTDCFQYVYPVFSGGGTRFRDVPHFQIFLFLETG